jgi:hypothetical protein
MTLLRGAKKNVECFQTPFPNHPSGISRGRRTRSQLLELVINFPGVLLPRGDFLFLRRARRKSLTSSRRIMCECVYVRRHTTRSRTTWSAHALSRRENAYIINVLEKLIRHSRRVSRKSLATRMFACGE